MQKEKRTGFSPRTLILAGLFLALGLLLPYFTGHAFGIPGTVLLPMHLPVLLCGMLCGWQYGMLCGLLAPVLSGVLTGMPALWPMMPIMACELLVYGFASGLLYRRLRLPVYVALPAAMLAGRVAYGLMFGLLTLVSASPLKAATVWAAVATGLPGIAIQLVLVPLIVAAAGRAQKKGRADMPQEHPQAAIPAAALDELRSGAYTCIVLKNGAIVHRAEGRGVKPLLALYQSDENRPLLYGSTVADKIVGKAAAMILVLGGVAQVHGETMSASARSYLQSHGIACSWGRCVDLISNRSGNGICPLENAVLEIDDPHQGYLALTETVKQLMANTLAN